MSGIKDLLFTYLLRLPFFLLVYTVILFITGEYGIFTLLFVIFTVIWMVDILLKRLRVLFILMCTLASTAFLIFGMLEIFFAILCFILNKPESYNKFHAGLMIFCLFCLTAVITLFIDPGLGYICIRNLVVAVVAAILANQVQTLDRFLNSYYCRGVSRKTVSMLIKWSYMYTIICLAGIVIIGFMVRPQGEAIPIQWEYAVSPDEFFASMEDGNDLDEMEIDGDIFIEPEEEYTQQPLPPEQRYEPRLVSTLIVVAAVLILFLFILLLYKYYHRIENRFEDFDEIMEEIPGGDGDRPGVRRRIMSFGVNHTVRRLFKRKVREYIRGKGLYTKKSDTPEVLSGAIGEWEDIGPLKQLYHKARYSGEHVKRAELKHVIRKS